MKKNVVIGAGSGFYPDGPMVGDSIFPGQSTSAVALGGLRVAEAVLGERAQTLFSQPGRAFGYGY